MNRRQSLLFAVLITTLAFSVVTYSACTKDPCKGYCLNGGSCNDGYCFCPWGYTGARCENNLCAELNCLNGGHCESGHCKCPAGYEGDNCELALSDKFEGMWSGTNTCDPEWAGGGTYLHIKPGTIPTEVIVGLEFYLPGPITAKITGPRTITLPEKRMDGSSVLAEGTITMMPDGHQLLLEYTMITTVAGSNVNIQCSSTFSDD